MSQGQSPATIDKERRIGAALSVGMQIASAKFGGKGYRFWHLDENCGPGHNQDFNVPGSPLVFWQIVKTSLSGMEPAPFFCDHNPEYMRELQRRLGAVRDKSVLLQGDNQEAIEVFAECIRRAERPKYAIGSILIDPNGYFYRNQAGDGAPVDAVKWFSREFPRIDLILNLNIRTYQMQTAHGHAVEAPREVLRSLNKAHWLVGQTHTAGRRFLLAIGRNMPTGDHRALGLYRLESPQGQWIMNLAEGKRQHELPELPRIPAASGIFGSPRSSHAPDQRPLPDLRRGGNGSPPHPVPSVGDVRRSIEHEAALPPLPLFGAREG